MTERSVREEERDGDPKWLDGMQRCVDMRLKIFGLYNSGVTKSDAATPISFSEQNIKAQMAILLSIFDELEEHLAN